MNTQHFDGEALLALPKVAADAPPERGLVSWSRPYLIQQIREEGIDVAAVRGIANVNAESGYVEHVVRPEVDRSLSVSSVEQLGRRALQEFGMMRTIVKAIDTDHLLPTLNPTALREITRDKKRTAHDVLMPIGMYGRSLQEVVVGDVDVAQKVSDIPGEIVVAKPQTGSRSVGVFVGGKNEVADQLQSIDRPYVLEEKLDFSPAWPGIRGYDTENHARLTEANLLGQNKELRLYSFGEGQWSAVARVAKTGETDFQSDDWLYLDEATIPEALYDSASAALDQFNERVGTRDVHVGIDFVYATTYSDPDPKWRIMEVNGGEPQLVQLSQHETIGRDQHTKLAKQIARLARQEK